MVQAWVLEGRVVTGFMKGRNRIHLTLLVECNSEPQTISHSFILHVGQGCRVAALGAGY